MTKAPTPTENLYKSKQQHEDVTKMFKYTTIADRLGLTSSFWNISSLISCIFSIVLSFINYRIKKQYNEEYNNIL